MWAALAWVVSAALAGGSLWATRRISRTDFASRLLAVSAWCGLAMIATYHRAHDGLVLSLLLLLVILLQLRALDG